MHHRKNEKRTPGGHRPPREIAIYSTYVILEFKLVSRGIIIGAYRAEAEIKIVLVKNANEILGCRRIDVKITRRWSMRREQRRGTVL